MAKTASDNWLFRASVVALSLAALCFVLEIATLGIINRPFDFLGIGTVWSLIALIGSVVGTIAHREEPVMKKTLLLSVIAFVVLLGLYYLGLTGTSALIPSRCTVGEALQCRDHELILDTTGAKLNVMIENTRIKPFTVQKDALSASAPPYGKTPSSEACSVSSLEVAPGERVTIRCLLSEGMTGGPATFPQEQQKIRAQIMFSFLEEGGVFTKTTQIEVNGRLNDGSAAWYYNKYRFAVQLFVSLLVYLAALTVWSRKVKQQ